MLTSVESLIAGFAHGEPPICASVALRIASQSSERARPPALAWRIAHAELTRVTRRWMSYDSHPLGY